MNPNEFRSTPRSLRIVRPKDACAILNISRPTLWRWRRAGIFPPARRFGPNTIGWPENELLAFIESRPRGGTPGKRDTQGENP